MTRCLQAIRHVIFVDENTAEEEPTALLEDEFVEPVARRTTLHPSVKQEKRHTLLNSKKTSQAKKNAIIV